jgi:hypothetical protein
MVANGWYENGFYDPGAWNIYVNRPSAAVDPETGYIYCMYQRYFNFGTETTFCTYSDTLPFPYLHGDTTYDWSAAGWPCGEIWVSKSVDNGYYWSEGINITNTHSLNAAPNDCSSELTPSVALQIQNDKFHIFYIEDRDAGAVVQTEGTWTLNEAIYHRVDLADIPIEPVLPPFPMHCDSSQMPTEPWQKVVADDGGFCPDNFTLEQNYPNPFNAQTSIKYSLSTDGFASLIVYNIKGEVVATIFQGNQKAGGYTLNFDASNLSSGIYFYRLEAQGFTHTAKMVLMK